MAVVGGGPERTAGRTGVWKHLEGIGSGQLWLPLIEQFWRKVPREATSPGWRLATKDRTGCAEMNRNTACQGLPAPHTPQGELGLSPPPLPHIHFPTYPPGKAADNDPSTQALLLTWETWLEIPRSCFLYPSFYFFVPLACLPQIFSKNVVLVLGDMAIAEAGIWPQG